MRVSIRLKNPPPAPPYKGGEKVTLLHSSRCGRGRGWVLVLLALSFASHARAQTLADFDGPAPLRNQRPYQTLFLTFTPSDARALRRGQHRERLQLDIANTLLIPDPKLGGGNVLEDAETQTVTLSVRQGLGKGWEAGAALPVTDRDGGILDNLVRFYHEGVGLVKSSPDVFPGRPNIPSYRSIIRSQEAGVDAGSAAGLGDLSLYAVRGLVSNDRRRLSVRAGLKLPTGDADNLLGSGGTDYGLDVDGARLLSTRAALFGSVGYEKLGRATLVRSAALDSLSYSLGAEYRARPGLSYVLQTDGGSRVVRTGNRHADAEPSTLALSVRRGTGKRIWTYSFTENGDIFGYKLPFVADIGPDVTFSAGLEWR